MSNIRAAMNQSDQMSKKLKEVERESYAAKNAMRQIKLDETQTAETRRKAEDMEKSLAKIYKAALSADDAVNNIGFQATEVGKFVSEAKMVQHELEKITRDADEAGRAVSRLAAEQAALGNASQLARLRTQVIRGKFEQADNAAAAQAASSISAQAATDRNASELARLRNQAIRGRFSSQPAMMPGFFGSAYRDDRYSYMGDAMKKMAFGATGRSAEEYLRAHGRSADPLESRLGNLFGGSGGGGRGFFRDLYNGGGRYGGGGGGRYNVPGLNFLAGVLPGGRRARPAAVLSGIGLAASTIPALGPAGVGLGAAGSAGILALLGGAGTLALAFNKLNAAAFTTQKGFDALTPAQQKFVMALKSLDAGLITQLEGLAQSKVIPGLTSALHQAFTPASAGALRGGVSAFGGAISGGAQQLGKLFGSQQFSAQFGQMLKQDAVLLRDMFRWASNLADAFVHLSVAAGPLVNWLAKGTTHFTRWIDESIKAAQASGRLAKFFDHARASLRAFGGVVAQLGKLLGAIGESFGFKNSVGVLNLFTNIIKTLTDFIRSNKALLRGFFSALIKSANDLNGAVRILAGGISILINFLRKIIQPLQDATGGFVSLSNAVDGLLLLMTIKKIDSILAMSAAVTGIGTAAAGSTALIWGLRGAILALLGIGAFKLGERFGKWLKGGNGGVELPPGIPIFDASGHEISATGYAPGGQNKVIPGSGISGLAGPVGGPTIGGRPLNAKGQIGGRGKNIFGTPTPFVATSSGSVLPVGLQTAIDKAGYTGSVSAQIAAIKTALNWIGSHAPKVKDLSQRDLYYQEGSALKSQLTSLTYKQMGGKPSALDTVFSPSHQRAVTAAESRFRSGITGSPHQIQQTATKLAEFAQKQIQFLKQEMASSAALNWTEKQRTAAAKELAKLHGDIAKSMQAQHRAAKAIAAEEKKTASDVFNKALGSFLGIGGDGSGNFGSVKNRERSTLMQIVKSISHSSGRHLKGTVSDPYSSIPNANHMSIPKLAEELYQMHAISKRALSQILGIYKFAGAMGKSHVRIDPENMQQIIAVLTQIKNNTSHLRHPSSFHVPNLKEIGAMTGIKNPQARMAAAQRLASFFAHNGKIPGGPDVFGLPFNQGAMGGGSSGGFFQNINIIIHGGSDSAEKIAHHVAEKLAKKNRRNTIQTRGPNAGRNILGF